MNTPVYINEIPAYGVHTDESNGETTHKSHNYNLLLPHLSQEFRNKSDNNVAVSCFPPFPFNQVVEDMICEYISAHLQNPETNIFFDNVYEGHVLSCLVGIHKIIQRLGLVTAKCYFISGAMQAQSLYNIYCQRNNIKDQVNIIILNSWERHVSITTAGNENISEPEFKIKNKPRLFLCFNRIFRPHRAALLGLMYNKDLVNQSYYSFFPNMTYGGPPPDIASLRPLLSLKTFNIIDAEFAKHSSEFPLLLNNPDGYNSNRVLVEDTPLYENSYFSIITETFFFKTNSNPPYIWEEESVFFSEKTFKPIMGKHPFVILSRPKSLHYLREIGYKTFHPFIDESYDTIENDELRLITVANEIDRLSKFTPAQWIKFLEDVRDIVEFNYKLLTNKTADDYQYTGENKDVQNQ